MTRAPILPAVASLLALALLVAACGGSAAPTPTPATTPSIAPGESATVAPPTPTPAAGTPAAGTATPGPGTPTPTPSGETPSDPGASPDVTPIPGAADACSGNDQNRDFFAKTASAVAWDVYCAVLPAGWFVETGSYRLANGGKMEITYAGPGGARLSLSQGAFCGDGSGCVPSGANAGEAAFGDRGGTLVAADGGRWAIVADRGATISWLLVTTGLDEAQTRAFGEALAIVAG